MICDIPRKYLTHLNELVELIESVWIDQKCEAMISIEEMICYNRNGSIFIHEQF